VPFLNRALLIALCLAGLAGCGLHAVRPYERAHLNDPSMRTNRDEVLVAQRNRSLTLREAIRDGRSDDTASRR
jgi:hypothetical protein